MTMLKNHNHYLNPPYTQIFMDLILSPKGQVNLGKHVTYLERKSSGRSKQTSNSFNQISSSVIFSTVTLSRDTQPYEAVTHSQR